MAIFDNIEKSLFEIKNSLLSNTEIRKLLGNDNMTCLDEQAPGIDTIEDFIFLTPVFKVDKEPYNKNSFISITLSEVGYTEDINYLTPVVTVSVLSRTELWVLNDSKIRPLQVASQIVKELNNKKVSLSHKLYFIEKRLLVLNEDIQGFILVFDLLDGGGSIIGNF